MIDGDADEAREIRIGELAHERSRIGDLDLAELAIEIDRECDDPLRCEPPRHVTRVIGQTPNVVNHDEPGSTIIG